MKKISIVALLMGFLLIALTGCTGQPSADAEKAVAVKTVVDIMDREVAVPKEIKSIVVSPIPYTSMIYAIDGTAEKLVAIHPSAKNAWSKSMLETLAPELADAQDQYIAQNFALNIEEIVKMNPDVVILWSNQEDDIIKLEQMNIPVVTLTDGANSDINEMRKNIRIIGSLLGKEVQAEQLIQYNLNVEEYFRNKLDMIQDDDKPKVLYLRDKELKASAGDSFNRQMIELTGGINVASDVKGAWTEVSMEQIITWDPEIIYLSHFDNFMPEDLYNNKISGQDWSQVTAVKNQRVYKTPIGIYRWDAPNAETPLFLKWMGQVQHPNIYNDYVLEDDIRDFYKKFFGHSLSNQEINQIFNR